MTSTSGFQVEPGWAKIPQGFSVGDVSGLAVTEDDHVWLIHRSEMSDAGPRKPKKPVMVSARGSEDSSQWTLRLEDNAAGEPADAPTSLAPPVMEFDAHGNFLRGWGGPGDGYEWPYMEHSLHIDYAGHVWLTSAKGDAPTTENQILKFTQDGEFVLQIGERGGCVSGSLDKHNVNGAADLYVHPKTNELFVADGYRNSRIVVFDADTGAFKRMWGAYGNAPDDSVPKVRGGYGLGGDQFFTVHGVRVSNDDLVYVADRKNNRVQVFTLEGDYITEAFYDRHCKKVGTCFSIAFSPDPEQRHMYVPDASNGIVRVIERESLRELGHFGSFGTSEGEFKLVHSIAVDSKGDIYTSEVIFRQRVQKWVLSVKAEQSCQTR